MIYAEIINGQIAQYITASGPLPAHKLRPDLLPVVEVDAIFDAETEVIAGHEDVILSDRVERRAIIAPRPVPPVPEEVTETQFIRACRKAGIITFEQGEAYLARGVLPPIMAEALGKLPADTREDMILKAVGSNSFSRSDEVFSELVKHNGATDEQIDAVFRLAATLK